MPGNLLDLTMPYVAAKSVTEDPYGVGKNPQKTGITSIDAHCWAKPVV